MPYVLQEEQGEYEVEEGLDPSQLPPAVVAAQGATSVLAASLRALAARRQSKPPCAPCEKKRRLQRLQALRQRG
mgnify:CR=1 FL=1